MMNVSVVSSFPDAGCIVVPMFEDEQNFRDLEKALPASFSLIEKIVKEKDFEGKAGQISLVYGENPLGFRIFLCGLGKEKECTPRTWKHAIGGAVMQAQSKKMEEVSLFIPRAMFKKFGVSLSIEYAVIGASVGAYSYDEFKQKDSRVKEIKTLFLFESEKKNHKEMQKGIASGMKIGEAINFTRHLGNTPPHVMTPEYLAKEAKNLEKENKKIEVKILSQSEIENLKMGCFLGVAQGSTLSPKFIIVEYWNGNKKEKPTVLVGKGITFDSGGISLKPGDYLLDMKFDMLGGATVLGTIKAAAALGVKKNIVGLVPACENMPSGNAYRPDDILVAMNGMSVEIVNTDAEGRLILADALCYAARYEPKEVLDFATLTGHCLVAIGNERSGLFGKDDALCSRVEKASTRAGEYFWRLPLGEEFTEAVKGTVADLQNGGGVGGSRYAGASTAAAFLEHFTSYPWAHVDLSCSHYNKNRSWVRAGANGFGVHTMVEYLRSV